MKIKTISQLTPVSDKDVVHDKAYLAIAQYSDSAGDGANAYLSRKLTYKQLKTQIEDYVDSDLLEGRYGSKLYIDGEIENVNLSAMHNDIEKLKNSDMTIRGVKHFNEIPTIDAEVDPESRDSNIPNVKWLYRIRRVRRQQADVLAYRPWPARFISLCRHEWRSRRRRNMPAYRQSDMLRVASR